MADYVDNLAELGSDDEEDQPIRRANGNGAINDSSDEDEESDEEEERKVREGFIVDSDEDDNQGDGSDSGGDVRRKKKRSKRPRVDEDLDAEDMELIYGEVGADAEAGQPKFKRLKQGHRATQQIFGSDDEEEDDQYAGRNEMDGFIEDDVYSDDDGRDLDDLEVARPGRKQFSIENLTAGLDETSMEDYYEGFGRGEDYGWALALEEEEEERAREGDPTDLNQVFEPGQLEAKLLTQDDMAIRTLDIPERLQLARKGYTPPVFDSDDAQEAWYRDEATWIGDLLWHKISRSPDVEQFVDDPSFKDAYNQAILDVIKLVNKDNMDIPFIYRNRRDYFVYKPSAGGRDAQFDIEKSIRILSQLDLWDIFEYDLRYQALSEKRKIVQRMYDRLGEALGIKDAIIEEMLAKTVSFEEVQDVQDYLYFQYSAQIKDLQAAAAVASGKKKRPMGLDPWDAIRSGQAYHWTRALGFKTDDFAQHLLEGLDGTIFPIEDPAQLPDELADELAKKSRSTSSSIERSAKSIFVEELLMNPKMRKYLRNKIYQDAAIDCIRTDKGKLEITEDHRYYEFKYIRDLDFSSVASRPDMYLRMLKAESEGLVQVRIRLINRERLERSLQRIVDSRGTSEIAVAWNSIRQSLIPTVVARLEKTVSRGAKDALKLECETQLARSCRIKFNDRLDVSAYPVPEDDRGDISVLAMSNGHGVHNRDAICWVYLDISGQMTDHGKFTDLRVPSEEGLRTISPGADNAKFIDLVLRHQPDVIGISGFSAQTRQLFKDVEGILARRDEEEQNGAGPLADDEKMPRAVLVQDEVARMYHTSDRAALEYPYLASISRYCVGLARYLRNPLHEYASLGNGITSISFDPNQDLVPQDKLLRYLEHALIDMINMVGVELGDAISDPYKANLLSYVCGLGPRKAARLLEVVQQNGGVVKSRLELLGDEENSKAPAMGFVVWNNCASFVFLDYDDDNTESDPLDNTRIHPEDYDIAKKIAGDALGLDEEDVQDENMHGGSSAVVRRLMTEKDRNQRFDALEELDLHQYADQIEKKFHQRKRATLENIREELVEGYEELRMKWAPMSAREIFTMLTGETDDSLKTNSIVPVKIRRIFADHIEVKLDCGVDGTVSNAEYPKDVGDGGLDPRNVYSQGQTVQAKLMFLNMDKFTATLALRRDESWDRKPFGRPNWLQRNEWDDRQEGDDKRELQKETETKSGRAQRVIKHPLFKPFNSQQAVEFLGSKPAGDVVIRPSSKGLDHLVVTWKVADNVFQHIDVLELDKENEFAVGKRLKIGRQWEYTDLDDLIVNHVKTMSKKVAEITADERFQKGSKTETNEWLKTYTKANPKRSMYAFCINPKFPGYFDLCYKAGGDAPLGNWPVKILPNAFELRNNRYPDMRSLKNGFKLMTQSASGRL